MGGYVSRDPLKVEELCPAGLSKAKELIFTAKRLNGEEAFNIGLVDRLVDAGKAYEASLEFAREILPAVCG